ncbi:MAG: spermidine synthase [Betaproteobacteria bacterium]|nr:spermidine synthase [Betaproteobacteria bacterium]
MHPNVTFLDYGDMRFLHLGSPAVQGSMQISKPFDIHLEYQQRMMAWLLFTDLNQVNRLHVMQMGLGAAGLTKFCHHHLHTQTTAVELNPKVIDTCRQWFKLPANSNTLQVLLANAADVARDPQWHQTIDVLQVDLYDPDALYPVLDTEAFYADCKQLLTHNGCMVVNVFGRKSNLANSLQKIAASFGNDAMWAFTPTSAGNAIVLAFRTPIAIDDNALLAQAQTIEKRWPLPATQWLKALAAAYPATT